MYVTYICQDKKRFVSALLCTTHRKRSKNVSFRPISYLLIIIFPVSFSYLKKFVILEETLNTSVRSRQSRKQMALPLLLLQGLIMLQKRPLVKMRRKKKYRPCRALILPSRMKLSLISSKCLQDRFPSLVTLGMSFSSIKVRELD